MMIKFFLGVPYSYQLKMDPTLSKIPYQGKEYLGRYLDEEKVSPPHIKSVAQEIGSLLNIDPQTLVLFSQFFYS